MRYLLSVKKPSPSSQRFRAIRSRAADHQGPVQLRFPDPLQPHRADQRKAPWARRRGSRYHWARVERPFHFIEGDFLAGRTFSSWEDLNQRAREWCDKVNSTYKKHIRAVPRELF